MNSLDLHGLTIEEAIPKIDHFLFQLLQQKARDGRIITGKGSGKIQKATIAYLEQGGYTWHYERFANGKDNPGALIVHID